MSDVEKESRCCHHCQFGLIVTGHGEQDFLPGLFSELTSKAGCSFKVLRKVGQRKPIGERKRQKMVGRGGRSPTKDEEEIGIPVRLFLRGQPCHFVILIDDVESDRRPELDAIWNRYRTALDTLLTPDERSRASVHFLANMLEAYYFADSNAVNTAFTVPLLANDAGGDVEQIRNPKNDLKNLARSAGVSFDEVIDGRKIVSKLNVSHILSEPSRCAFLRALFGWCVRKLMENCPVWDESLASDFHLAEGVHAPLTGKQ
jgi:hypothetical protein